MSHSTTVYWVDIFNQQLFLPLSLSLTWHFPTETCYTNWFLVTWLSLSRQMTGKRYCTSNINVLDLLVLAFNPWTLLLSFSWVNLSLSPPPPLSFSVVNFTTNETWLWSFVSHNSSLLFELSFSSSLLARKMLSHTFLLFFIFSPLFCPSFTLTFSHFFLPHPHHTISLPLVHSSRPLPLFTIQMLAWVKKMQKLPSSNTFTSGRHLVQPFSK